MKIKNPQWKMLLLITMSMLLTLQLTMCAHQKTLVPAVITTSKGDTICILKTRFDDVYNAAIYWKAQYDACNSKAK